MVKYLFDGGLSVCLLALLFVLSTCASRQPTPNCTAPKVILRDLPISPQEMQSFNLNNFFTGYNLNISANTKPEFATLNPRIYTLRSSNKAQPGLRNYHLAHTGNVWGSSLITLSENGNYTRIRWGIAGANDTLPNLTNEMLVENSPTVHCYDAVWMTNISLAIIDCTRPGLFTPIENVFYYVNTTDKTTLDQKVKTDMYVPFTMMRRRKIFLLEEEGESFLIRAYFADAIDEQYRYNTYLYILQVNNPLRPFTIRVMDRSFLHQDKLSIEDFKVYLGDIYILDYHSGVIQFDITPSQTIVITGRYRTDSGFRRLGVYSNNMDNEFLLVLANDHAIFEVDWTNQIQPYLVTKYSIMEQSYVRSLWVNEEYVVAQIEANVTDSKNVTIPYHSTFVFGRGTRTYLNAYAVVPHSSYRTFADLNRDRSQILTIDYDGLSIYQLNTPILYLTPIDPSLLAKRFTVDLTARSSNEYSGYFTDCNFTMNFIIVPQDIMGLWPTGLYLPYTYYANFPGQLFIPLDRYIIGANITYNVVSNDKEYPPVSFVLQQNTTKLHWAKYPSLGKITFIRQYQYDSLDDTELFLYTQDAFNKTHLTHCDSVPFSYDVYCNYSGYAPGLNKRIANLTANRFHYYGGRYLHLAAILYEDIPNEIFIYDVYREANTSTKPIMFPYGYYGKIHSVYFLGQYLVVVLKYIKYIVFFDMIQCHDHQEKYCLEVYRVNSRTMTQLGVKYFAPLQVYTSDFHPYVLFVQNMDSVIILDITRQGPILLAVVESPGSKEPGPFKFQVAIAQGHLILVNPPNTIEEHSLQELTKTRKAPVTKSYPLYGYTIPDNFDLDFSDDGNLVYITALDPKLPNTTNSVILVYKSGVPAVSTFYDVFHLNARYDEILIDVTGVFGDYIAVAIGSMLLMFRQYEIPILVLEDIWYDYSFNITYTNDPYQRYHSFSKTQVKTANYPEYIIVNDTQLNQSDFLSKSFTNMTETLHEFDDVTWFNGSVINYTLDDCDECNNKVQIINHLYEYREVIASRDMYDYVYTNEGGVIQQFQSLIKMRHNGSVEQYVAFPSVFDGESCTNIQSSWTYGYTLSACKQTNEVYLYTTVYTASKPFVNGPYYSSAKNVLGMHLMEDILVLVDVDENPWRSSRDGSLIIYAMNHDPFEPEIFDYLEVIDGDDLSVASAWPGGPVSIGNAHLAFTNDTTTYRLIISELNYGFFVLDFTWTKGRKSIEILRIEFINLKEELIKVNLPMPNAAFFTAITISKYTYDTTYTLWQIYTILVTSNFHSFQINLYVPKTGSIKHTIAKVFYRYGFYYNHNYIKTFDGYFAIAQRVPTLFYYFDWYSKQILSVYDTRERWIINKTTGYNEKIYRLYDGTNIPVTFLLGGYVYPPGRLSFDFNFTFVRNSSNPLQRIGLVALHNLQARIHYLSIHDHLIIMTAADLQSNQRPRLRAQNDFHKIDFYFNINFGGEGLAGWAIALIVIACLAIAAAVGYIVFLKFVKGKRNAAMTEGERSLLEKEGPYSDYGDDVAADDDEEDDDDEDDDEEEEEEEEEEGYGTPVSPVPIIGPVTTDSTIKQYSVTNPSTDRNPETNSSINRETISEADEYPAVSPVEVNKGDNPKDY